MTELKSCPFCSAAPRYLEAKAGFYTERVICDDCGFHLPPEEWNRRSPGVAPESSPAVPVVPAEPVARWVPVTERLPALGEEVLVHAPNDKFRQVAFDEWSELRECPVDFSTVSVVVGEGWSEYEFEEVTHWMPLPAPPVSQGLPIQKQPECPHDRATGDEFNGRCPDCGVTWQTVRASRGEDLRDVIGVRVPVCGKPNCPNADVCDHPEHCVALDEGGQKNG